MLHASVPRFHGWVAGALTVSVAVLLFFGPKAIDSRRYAVLSTLFAGAAVMAVHDRGGRRSMRQGITSSQAPAPIGPYSPAVKHCAHLFLSGQTPLDPATGKLVEGSIQVQTRRVMENLRAVLAAAGCDFGQVVKTNIYLTDMADFDAMNEVYGEYFEAPYPARTTVQVAGLPKGARVEIEMVAALPGY